jgi:hypothetical protein
MSPLSRMALSGTTPFRGVLGRIAENRFPDQWSRQDG